MAELPHMPMFWGDYFGDTTHLTTVEHGAYLLLIGTYWRQGHGLPDDDARLARLVRMSKKEWLATRDILAEFFAVTDGVWLHNRVEQELTKARRKVEQASSAGRASAASRSNGRSTDVQREGNDRPNGRATGKQPTRTITIKNPLTPLRCADADAPGPSCGRASASDVAKPIGEIIQRRAPA